MKVLFIRGLNTYADEIQHFGPLTFGEISGPLTSCFRLVGMELIPIENLGSGSLEEHIDNAVRTITGLPEWKTQENFHVLGHSIGGLIGRALVHRPEMEERILSVGSIGTPHRGAEIAEIAMSLEQRKPWLQKVMAACNYDTAQRTKCFASLNRDAVLEFNEKTPDLEEVAYFSAVCSLPRDLQALPYRLMHRQMPDFLEFEESDGLIPAASQRHGRILGHYQLDHMMEVGFCLDVRPRIRSHFKKEFNRMVADLVRYYQRFGRMPDLC